MYEQMLPQDQLSTVGFEITNHCNLRCLHCYEGEMKCDKHLSLNQIDEVISKTVPFLPRYFVLTGGEPFLHPDIDEILKLLAEKYSENYFYFATNGTMITPKILGLLAKKNNIFIQISLDGSTEQTHNLQHGNSFDLVMRAIEQVKTKLSPERLSLQMTISKINYKECIDVAKFAERNNIKVRFQFVCMVGKAKENEKLLELLPLQKAIVYRKLKFFSEKHPDMGIVAPKSMLSCSFSKLDSPISLNIDINGEVTACTCFDTSFSLGNMFNDSMKSILTSPTIQKIHELVLERKEHLSNTVCKNCMVYNKCEQGCLGRAISIGDAMGLDGECDFRKALLITNKLMGMYKNGSKN